MRKIVKTFCILMLILSASCKTGGGAESIDGQDVGLQLLTTDALYNTTALNGYGGIVAVPYLDTSNQGRIDGFKETLKFYQYNDQNPDALTSLGGVYTGIDTLYHRVSQLNLNQYWAILTLNNNLVSEGYVSLVSLSNLPQLKLTNTYSFNKTLDGASASANFLFVYHGVIVDVYDISDTSQPKLATSFTLSSKITSSVAMRSGLFYTTSTGFGFINTESQVIDNTEKADFVIRNLKKSYMYDDILYGGGESSYVGKTSILKVDLTNPINPVILASNNSINDVFSDFAYDGNGGYYLISGDITKQYNLSGNTFVFNRSGTQTTRNYINIRENSRFYSWNARLFYLSNGLAEYKFK